MILRWNHQIYYEGQHFSDRCESLLFLYHIRMWKNDFDCCFPSHSIGNPLQSRFCMILCASVRISMCNLFVALFRFAFISIRNLFKHLSFHLFEQNTDGLLKRNFILFPELWESVLCIAFSDSLFAALNSILFLSWKFNYCLHQYWFRSITLM